MHIEKTPEMGSIVQFKGCSNRLILFVMSFFNLWIHFHVNIILAANITGKVDVVCLDEKSRSLQNKLI